MLREHSAGTGDFERSIHRMFFPVNPRLGLTGLVGIAALWKPMLQKQQKMLDSTGCLADE